MTGHGTLLSVTVQTGADGPWLCLSAPVWTITDDDVPMTMQTVILTRPACEVVEIRGSIVSSWHVQEMFVGQDELN